ncbi:DUF2358 domain-containing protein [filamentous cyanobacterium LEGE 11480]|uniref:DUF2358 domain-containing protein n=1 Tax=Romeriopsis navalis LEGE 11480 TaxID=2777977 RepID=A0A928Z5V9_9CYAN|nr:DUF2358 domain-containing protein [Romeriopsis navalis]MBE9031670.1 DUF2358 domain-containing protein [Romeriopsis navalis LEGE 11480]
MDILQRLREDYQRFPLDQSYDLYAADVRFKDPMNEFRGVDRYQKMIGFIQRFFTQPQLELHHIQQSGPEIRTDWTLSWTTPLPWQPRIRISGWSELQLDAAGLICAHIDYWHCSKLDVLKQHLPIGR